MPLPLSRPFAALVALVPAALAAQQPAPTPAPGAVPGAAPGAAPGVQAPPVRRGPRPYAQVVTDRAVTDKGGITVHKVEDRILLELPDSLAGRDFLLVTRVAGVPAGFDGFISAGTSIGERLVRFERAGERMLLRAVATGAYADDSLPIARSVAVNNTAPILGAFPVAAFTRDSASKVVDVTDWLAGDTPALSGLSAAQRRQYQVRRLDPARSFVSSVKSFPLNVEVRHVQTYEAGEPPSEREAGVLTVEMRQSLVLLPRVPMRPRFADPRVGYFETSRVNYGLDEQKAATETFIQRWRLEPKDPAAYARGELVEPVTPITYYLDPATPAKWRRYVREGVEAWNAAFEAAGFRNAIQAKEPPTPAQDPEWDPEDIRYSVVRWVASTVRNAVGPSTADPRTGEIIESDITWYHNHMRSYRNRLMIETGVANPAARSLEIPEALMGETMRQVITHEVGHALGLPHNMIASASFPVDSLRSPSFTRKYGVSATIMDYARQNYVAQPGDGLEPKDFVRRLGPWDNWVIDWGYRVLPQAATPEAERAILNRKIVDQRGPMPYRYSPQFLSGIDPRSQTEDIGDDPIRATTFALRNMRALVPQLASWTTRPGEDYEDLAELYGETLGMWGLYMGHVTSLVGGMSIDFKSSEQAGSVYAPVPAAKQRAALAFLAEQALRTPTWLAPTSILSRIGPQAGGASLATRQAAVVASLLDARRLDRLALSETLDPDGAWGVAPYLADVRRAVFTGAPLDANRRTLQRVHLERLEALLAAPAATPPAQFGGRQLPVLLLPPNPRRSDLAALARAELRAVRDLARTNGAAGTPVTRAHWRDVADRVDEILEKQKSR
jgi:hypothetical protein